MEDNLSLKHKYRTSKANQANRRHTWYLSFFYTRKVRKITTNGAQSSNFLIFLDFFYTQPKNLHSWRYRRSWQISGMSKRLGLRGGCSCLVTSGAVQILRLCGDEGFMGGNRKRKIPGAGEKTRKANTTLCAVSPTCQISCQLISFLFSFSANQPTIPGTPGL